MAPATPIGSRTRGAKSLCSSSFFINASAVPSPTVCSIIRQTPRGHRRRHSKPPIEKPTDRFSRCWTFSLRKCLNSETKILRLVHQEPSTSDADVMPLRREPPPSRNSPPASADPQTLEDALCPPPCVTARLPIQKPRR